MPSVLPLKSAGFLMPVSARHVSSSPDFLKVCEILTSGTPFSLDANADGIQSTTTSAPPPAITCGGATSGPRGLSARQRQSHCHACCECDDFFHSKLQKLKEPAELGSIGWMPESGRALGQRDKSVKRHSRERGERDLRPHHVERHAARLRRDAKTDALRRRAEELGDD